jgi:hypothetical protein
MVPQAKQRDLWWSYGSRCHMECRLYGSATARRGGPLAFERKRLYVIQSGLWAPCVPQGCAVRSRILAGFFRCEPLELLAALHASLSCAGVSRFRSPRCRCMADTRAFISRRNHGKQGTTFVAYERTLPQHTGMVLLDATANIDGVTELCSWRKHVKVPQERYDRLEIVPTTRGGRNDSGRVLRVAGRL